MSGLAVAHTLASIAPEIAVHILESSAVIGGRAATRTRDGARFDSGAQFFRPLDDAQNQFFSQSLPHETLIDIAKPVHTFDRENRIAIGDSSQNTLPKYVYRDGIATLADLLLPPSVTLSLQTPVDHIVATSPAGYAIIGADGRTITHADAVVWTAPAPQLVPMLQASTIDEIVKNALSDALARVSYRPCLSVSLLHQGWFDPDYYALVNTDRGHPLSWLAVEHAKDANRVPAGQTLFTAQLGPAASRSEWSTDQVTLTAQVDTWVRALTGHRLAPPLWADVHAWPAALPDGQADAAVMQAYERTHGLYFAGDAHTGLGRIQLALAHGQTVAQRIAVHAGEHHG